MYTHLHFMLAKVLRCHSLYNAAGYIWSYINLYRPNVPYMERSLYVPIYGRYLCVALRMH
jgi:hypothetical protein